MKRKFLSVLMCLALAVATFTGCGTGKDAEKGSSSKTGTGNTETDKAETDKGESKETKALKWSVWDQKTTPYWDQLADAYMEKNKDVKIELVDLGSQDYQTVLGTDLSGGGSDFDIVTIKDVPGYATLISKGVLEPLNDRIREDNIDLGKFAGTTEQVTVDGKLYELPFRTDFWLLFYNKDLFDQAKAEYPGNDMTLEEYDKLARSVAKDGVYGSHYHTWRSAVQLFGILDGKHSILDGKYEFTKPYYEMVLKQQEDGICRSYSDINASQLHYSAAFSEGDTATMNMGSWYIGQLVTSLQSGEYDKEKCGNWGIASYPHPEGAKAGSTLGTITGLSIPTSGKNKDIAWDFIKFVSGEEGAKILAELGNFPAAMNDDALDIITSVEGFPQDEASKEALKTNKIYLEAPYAGNVADINAILDTYHKDIMNGDISVNEGINQMDEEVSALD